MLSPPTSYATHAGYGQKTCSATMTKMGQTIDMNREGGYIRRDKLEDLLRILFGVDSEVIVCFVLRPKISAWRLTASEHRLRIREGPKDASQTTLNRASLSEHSEAVSGGESLITIIWFDLKR